MASKKSNYAFIDSQNLNLGVRSLGWKVDYRKLRLYLKNKYNVEKAYMFIGLVQGNQKLYSYLQSVGFILVFKTTVRYFVDGKETVKGNVDAELVLHASAIEYVNYDKAIVITGDGDFACLMEFLVDHNKLEKIITPTHKYSQLLQPYRDFVVKAEQIRSSIEYKDRNQAKVAKTNKLKNQPRRSVKTLGLAGNGDTKKIAKNSKKVNPNPKHNRLQD